MRSGLFGLGLGLLVLAPLQPRGQTEDARLASQARIILEKQCFDCYGKNP